MKFQTSTEAEAAATAASASLKATITGGGMLTLGGLAANDVAMIGGLVLGVAGLVLQWHFQSKRDRREEREHLFRMSEIGDK